jgi:hypothetical protein
VIDKLVGLERCIQQLRTNKNGDLVARVTSVFGHSDDATAEESQTATGTNTEGVTANIEKAIELACSIGSSALLEGATAETKGRISAVLKTLYYVKQMFSCTLVTKRVLASSADASSSKGDDDDDLAAGIARFAKLDLEDANKMQQLLLYLLNCAQSRGYRRCNGECYQRRFTPEGHDTHAWEVVCSIQDFIYDTTRKELNYDMWLNMTSMRTNVSAAIEHLSHCHDVQFPDLVRDRHVFSFRNGVYLAAKDVFVRYGSPEASTALPSDLVAAKYFDLEFVDPGSGSAPEKPDDAWLDDIPTPHLQSILDYQGMGREVTRWMFIMLGRLLYDLNEHDRWQVIPYLKGAASSGKSTILTSVCKSFYDAADVGVLSNNIERKFGLSALHDKFLFVGPEIKSDVAVEQAEFQSVASGEPMQLAVKFKTAVSIVWKVPGILAGNEVPGWVDNSGSINRRIVLFEFTKRVDNGDMDLGKKLGGEMAAILLKANRGYLWAVKHFARNNIWKHLPEEFHRAKQEFTENVNSLVHFLGSSVLTFAPNNYMPLERLTTEYREYAERLGLERIKKLSGDALVEPLRNHGCVIIKNITLKYPRDGTGVLTCNFVRGADFAETERRGPTQCVIEDDPLGG